MKQKHLMVMGGEKQGLMVKETSYGDGRREIRSYGETEETSYGDGRREIRSYGETEETSYDDGGEK